MLHSTGCLTLAPILTCTAAQVSSQLCGALGAMALERSAHEPLRGLPISIGRHTRFADDGAPNASPGRLVLRGLPAPAGSHVRFDD